MRELYLLRHAKSSWQSNTDSDHDRPLNRRGLRDAPLMAQRLLARDDIPEIICCSSATRTTTTAELIATGIDRDTTAIRRLTEAYTFDAHQVMQVIRTFDDSETSIMLVGHNPGLTVLANQFSTEPIANVPTCGLLKLVSTSEHWSLFEPDNTELLYFDYPKNDDVIE